MAEIAFLKANANKTDIDPARVDEVAGKQPMSITQNPDGSFTIRGVTPETFFGPGQPLPPLAQDPELGAVGRRFDYITGYNQHYRPRSTEQIGFPDLRNLADNLDILRLVIETRKDQMESLDWRLSFKDPDKIADEDPEVQKIAQFLAFPDREHSYSEWMRAILEDLFVIDAPTIYPRLTNGGDLFSLDLVDGATIIPRLDATGRRPDPPSVAYQQIIKGVVAADYAVNELIYRPRNVRTHKIYGYSPVEQIVVTVNIALRRTLFLMGYYTDGSIPDAFGMVPDTWTPAMIAEYQQHWDAYFENPTGDNFAARRKMRWVPGAKDIKFAKDAILKDEFDEWLARVVCYAFSVEPTPFIKQMNRATAGTQQEQSRSEGLLPLKKWWKSFMDYILVYYFKRPDLEFTWDDEEDVDPKTRADINVAYVGSGILSANEVREDLGKDPLTKPLQLPGMEPGVNAKPFDQPAKPDDKPPAAADDANKVRKKLRTGKPMNSDRRAVAIQTHRLARGVRRQFRGQMAKAIDQLANRFGRHGAGAAKAASAADAAKLAQAAVDNMDLGDADFVDEVTDPLRRVAADGAQQAASSVGFGIDIDQVNEFALSDAAARGAEMVGKKWVDGKLVDNPNADWVIADETRAGLRALTAQAIEEGWSTDQFADEIRKATVFSAERAEMIARTETAYSDSRGHLEGWKQSGVEKVVWLTANDDLVSDECAENGEAGALKIGDEFPSGDSEPPTHPHCRCALAPYYEEDNAVEEAAHGAIANRMTKYVRKFNEPRVAAALDNLAKAVADSKVIINMPEQKPPVVNISPPAVTVGAPVVNVAAPVAKRTERIAVRDPNSGLTIKTVEVDQDDGTEEQIIYASNPYKVVHRGAKYCVVKITDGSTVPGGCHPTKEKAIAHLGALESNVKE